VAEPQDALIGSKVGPYEVLALLGEGGMGRVYRARHESLGRDAALKVILSTTHVDPEDVRRFKREARLMSRLSHPNVVRLYDCGSAGDLPWIAMELIPGQDLKQRSLQGPRPTVADVVEWVRQACSGIAALHEAGVVHRDLKPENLMLLIDGSIRVMDFGLAKSPEATLLTAAGDVIGTPAYVAPETLTGQPYDERSDVYQLGMVLYILLAGRSPFACGTLLALLQAIATQVPASLRTIDPRVPVALDALVSRCLAKAPADRPGSARELLDGLSTARAPARSRPRPARPVPPQERPAEAPPRSWRSAAAVAVGGLCLLCAPVVLLRSPEDGRPSRAAESTASAASAAPIASIAPPASTAASPAPPPSARSSVAPPPSPAGPSRSPDDATMVRIPSGWFQMGSLDGEADEQPVRRVVVDAFDIDANLVTNQRYRRFLDATGHTPPAFWTDGRWSHEDQPVVGAHLDDVLAFCRWAGKRLPTEAEWERAARGGAEQKLYPWGNDPPDGRACFGLPATGRPCAVGSYPANAFGLYDMAGNVKEWCSDWYESYAPGDVRSPTGPRKGQRRVLRGGSWFDRSALLRCAARESIRLDRSRPFYGFVGFRCARSVSASAGR
jgi:serine/threonine-protein kinase